MADKDNKHEHCCSEQHNHKELIETVSMDMPEEEVLYDLAELFKVFGDTTRIKILYTLFESEMCVCDIAEVLNMTQSAISHQLKVLKQAKLVKNRRDGKQIIYSLDDGHIANIITMGIEHIME
ncbi:MAG: winged helix-turn-helix transcriptional regulator [Lachnospiraceae bacterium]|nr:winged helix-turn-helix transcriptional regulator [Lachnospiraceae bacterium]